jgi:hypothetical protein
VGPTWFEVEETRPLIVMVVERIPTSANRPLRCRRGSVSFAIGIRGPAGVDARPSFPTSLMNLSTGWRDRAGRPGGRFSRELPVAQVGTWGAVWFVALCGPALAALPPQHQRMAEFRAIVGDGSIARAFGATPIDRIERVGRDLYRVEAGDCSLDVAIVSNPNWNPPGPWSGARKFILEPGRAVCK